MPSARARHRLGRLAHSPGAESNLQKVYGARDDRAVRLGVGGNALLLFAFEVRASTRDRGWFKARSS